MVLEISATPYIFTFKLWDWARLGLDGKPRPIHLEHGLANIQWDRDADWVAGNLINRIQRVAEGPGWIEERTGLHEREFIETRRHWFDARDSCRFKAELRSARVALRAGRSPQNSALAPATAAEYASS